MKYFDIVFLAAVCAALSGCGKEHKAPPTDRNQLVIRFFQSLDNGKSEAAALQGRKLMALDPGNEYIRLLVEIQESNTAVYQAQKAINAGKIDRAIDYLNDGIAKYPENRALIRARAQVRQLRHAKKLLNGMEIVNTPESMNSALTAASTGLAANLSPKLDKYFKDYEKRIEDAEEEIARREEEERAQKAAQEAAEAAANAPADAAPQVDATSQAPAETTAPVENTTPTETTIQTGTTAPVETAPQTPKVVTPDTPAEAQNK